VGHGSFRRSVKLGRVGRVALAQGMPSFDYTQGSQHIDASEGGTGSGFVPFMGNAQINRLITQTTTPSGPPSKETGKLFLESVAGSVQIQNNTKTIANIVVYDIMRKRDQSDVDTTADPWSAFVAGLTNMDNADPGTASKAYNMLRVPLSNSQLFTQFFRVQKRISMTLAQGALYQHHVNMRCNRVLPEQLIVGSKQDGAYPMVNRDLAGYAHYVVIVCSGAPVYQTSVEAPKSTSSSCTLDVVWSARAKYRQMAGSNGNVYYSNQLPAVQNMANELFLNPGTGLISTNNGTGAAGSGPG